MRTLSPADPSPSVAVEGVSLFLDFPAELVGAVAGDSVLSLLTAEVASLFLVLVAAPVEVASEAVALALVVVAGFVGAVAEDSVLSLLTAEVVSLFLDILSLLIEGVVVFL